MESQAWDEVYQVLACMGETHQRLKGLTGSIKTPDLDGGVLAPTEEQLSCLGQTQNSSLQYSGACVELSVQHHKLCPTRTYLIMSWTGLSYCCDC